MNPYSVLGVKPGATKEEVKKAYHKLVRENHPDRFLDETEKKKATARLAQINEAYSMIEKGQTGDFNGFSGRAGNSDSSEALLRVRHFINTNEILAAQSLLNAITNKTAEWHYLQGMVYMRQGYYDSAKRHIENAVNMEPMNREYQNAYNNFRSDAAGFYGSNPYIDIRSFSARSCCLPALCASMCCSNCCFGLRC